MADGLFGKRLAIPSIQQVGIQPAGIPGSTFVRPQQVQLGSNAETLLRAMAKVDASFNRFLAVQDAEQDDPNSPFNRKYTDPLQGKTTAELAQEAKAGTYKNEVQKAGLMTLLGSQAGADFRLKTSEWLETEYDQNGGNLQEELQRRRQEVSEGLPDDAARASFFRATEEWSQRELGRDAERRAGQAIAVRNDAVVSELRMIADDGLEKNTPPQEIASQVLRQSGLNRTFRGLTGQEQNATLYAIAQAYAVQGKPELVKALLEDDRGGVGSLMKTADYAVKGTQLIETAEKARDGASLKGSTSDLAELYRLRDTGELTSKKLEEFEGRNVWLKDDAKFKAGLLSQAEENRVQATERLRRDQAKREQATLAAREEARVMTAASATMRNSLGAQTIEDQEVPTASGGTRTITRQAQIDRTVRDELDAFRGRERDLITKGAAPAAAADQVLREKVNFFSGNGVSNPEWERMFSASAITGSAARIAAGGEIPRQLAAVAETYYKVDKLNPAFAASLVKDTRAADFLEAYADARDDLSEGGAQDPQEALLEAARLANRSSTERQATFVSRKDAEAVVKNAIAGGWFFGPSVDDSRRLSPQNLSIATDLAQKYMSRGMPEKLALKKAEQVLEDKAVYVNGVAILGTGKSFPKDFSQAAEGYLDDLAKKYDPKAAGDEFFLADPNNGTDRFYIMRKEDGRPIGTIGDAELNQWRKAAFDKEKVDAFVKRQAKNDGIEYGGFLGSYYRKKGVFGLQKVKPVVTWTDDDKSVRWEDEGD